MESKHNCIDCARAKFIDNLGIAPDGKPIDMTLVTCEIAIPKWIQKPKMWKNDNNTVSFRTDDGFSNKIENCPAWYPNTPPQWTLPEWNVEGEYAVLSGVTHNGKRWECFKENGGRYGEAVEPGTDANVWREAK